MATILTGKEVADKISQHQIERVKSLKDKGIMPNLAIVRVGENPSDLSYEKGAMTRAEKIGVNIENVILPKEIETAELLDEIEKLNSNEKIDGILIFRPLPKHIDDEKIRNSISKGKDVDGISDLSMAGIYSDGKDSFAPCTAEACIEILKYYDIDIKGKDVVVLGRSLVIGKPVAMMLLKENATVTICHSKSENISEKCKKADVIISAVGRIGTLTKDMVSEKQVILDVGINVDASGKICGDVDFDSISDVVDKITPVPRGIGSITTSILMKNTVDSATKRAEI